MINNFKGLSWPGNCSWSAFNSFKDCERRHFYEKVLKCPTSNDVETKYGRFGNCVHEAIEHLHEIGHYDTVVTKYWEKYKLYESDMSYESALKQVTYATELDYDFKHKEEVVLFSIEDLKFKLIIDGTLQDGSILDWKTSTFNAKKVEDYKQQLLWYTWGTWKKKGTIPPKAILVFTKAEKVFEWSFTEAELVEFEKMIVETITLHNTKKAFTDYNANFSACFFCGFKSKCMADQLQNRTDMFVDIKIDHDFVKIETPMPSDFNEIVSSQFSYEMDNAHFVKKAMAAKGVKNFDTQVRLYKNQKTAIGFKKRLVQYLNQYGEANKFRVIINEIDNRINEPKFIDTPSKLEGVELRPYQKKAIKHIMNDKISMTEICTGAGKTIMAAEIIRKIGKKTLFVVDRNVLLTQTVDEFEKHFDSVGTWTSGELNDADIVVATIQTIAKSLDTKQKLVDVENYMCTFGNVIVDEAHGAKSKSYQKLMKVIDAEYRIALTGTAYSDGNNSLELYKSFGFPDFKIRAKDLIDAGYLVKPEIKFLPYDEGFITFGVYNEVYDQVLACRDRVARVEELIVEHKDNNILMMVDRIEHIDMMAAYVGEKQYYIIQGSTKKKDRDIIIDKIRNSKGNLLIATSSIIQKGVDIPTLDVIINYSANLGTIKTVQSLGRVLRKAPGKDKAWYYDFEDTHKALKGHTKARKDALIEQGYEF